MFAGHCEQTFSPLEMGDNCADEALNNPYQTAHLRRTFVTKIIHQTKIYEHIPSFQFRFEAKYSNVH